MKGYEIFEQKYLREYMGEDGIVPHENRIGFLDFLRELISGVEGIPSCSSYIVTGIEEVLFLAEKREREELAFTIHRVLQSAAPKLEQKKIEVQIACKGDLQQGASFWSVYRGEKLYLDSIFGTLTKRDIRKCPVYSTSFNLSS